MKPKTTPWKLCITAVIILTLIAYSPLVIAHGQMHPMLFGIPRTAWMGILIYLCIMLLTFIGVRVMPRKDD